MIRLQALGLTKRCPDGRLAVDSVDLDLEGGSVVAVCGENGAGKTTLLRMVAGLAVPDGGEIRVDGAPVRFEGPRAARALGIAIVQQHLALVGELDAVENAALYEGARGWFARGAVQARLQATADKLGLTVPLDRPTASLGLGDRQRIELVRALAYGGRLLILDEPTAVLLPDEARALYQLLRRIAHEGTAVVVVTHRLGEVAEHADRVVVLTRGKKVHDAAFDRQEPRERALGPITRAIMGSYTRQESVPLPAAVHDDRLVVDARGLGAGALREASLQVRAGQIVGIAGLEGNGQHELMAVLTGARRAERGSLHGADTPTRAFVVGDRHAEGLFLDASLADNVMLGDHAELGWGFGLGSLWRRASDRLRALLPDARPDWTARSLSGGNQQKVVLARALARLDAGSRLLCLSEPTRGVDTAAQAEIHRVLRERAAAGAAIVVQSSDLDELRGLAHALYVLAKGELHGPFAPDTSDERLGRLMLGVATEAAP